MTVASGGTHAQVAKGRAASTAGTSTIRRLCRADEGDDRAALLMRNTASSRGVIGCSDEMINLANTNLPPRRNVIVSNPDMVGKREALTS